MSAKAPTPRTTVKRLPDRGVYERETIDTILDEALYCHVAVVADGSPRVIPTIHARKGDTLLIHGSNASRTLRAAKDGSEICVAVTILDGLILARSAFNHSMNYRSVVVFGIPREKPTPMRSGRPRGHWSSTSFRAVPPTPGCPARRSSGRRPSWLSLWTR